MLNRIAVILALLAAVSFAQKSRFAALDIDGSGGLSFAEIRAAYPDIAAKTFARHDVNGDGELSEAEFAAWRASKAGGAG